MPPSNANSLLLPDGSFHSLQEPNVVPINRAELVLLSKISEFTSKHGIELRCMECGQSIMGRSNGTHYVPAVACQCREFRYTGT